MDDKEHMFDRRYDWRRVEQWENLNARGYKGNAMKDYFGSVQEACKRLYNEHREEGVDHLHVEINDWRYLLLACQLIDDAYEEAR